MSGVAGGIAAIGLTAASAAAQDATSEPTGEGLSGPERARLAAELFTALVPVIVTIRAQTAEELAQAAKDYLAQLKEQQNITEEEGTALQQIVDVASSESDGRTKLEQIQDIVADLSEERDDESSVAAT